MDTEISQDNYDNIWLYTNGKSLEIDTIEEVQAIKDACIIFLEKIDKDEE